MAKIDRYNGNVEAFASQADTNDRTTFGTEITGDDTLDGNVTPSFFEGWGIVDPNEHPSLQDFNALGYTLSQYIAYLHQMGVAEWNGGQRYQVGSIANRAGALYACKTAEHVSATPPESDAVNWRPLSVISAISIASLEGLDGQFSGQQIFVSAYRDITDFSGGGRLVWNPNRLKTSHDGFRYFDPLKAFPADWSNEAQKLAWFTGDNLGNGVWERPADTELTIGMSGANANVAYSSSVEIQNCLNKRVALRAGSGVYVVGTTLVYDTTGEGDVTGLRLTGAGKYDTIFDNRTGGQGIQLEAGTGLTDFQRGLHLSGFTIDDTTASATSIGLFSTSNFRGFIGDILVKNQGLDGLYFSSTVGDATDNYQITIRRIESQNNGRHGMLISGDPNAINGGFDVRHNLFINNGGLGIAAYSCTSSSFSSNGIAYNLGGGLEIGHAGGPFSKNIEIHNNEFDSNAGIQINLDQVLNTDLGVNYFTINDGAPTVTELVHVTGNARNITVSQSQPRMPAGYTGVTGFVVEAGAVNVIIQDTDWSSWESAGNTKFDVDATTNALIRDENEWVELRAQRVKFPAVQVPSADPNVLDDYEEKSWDPALSSVVNISSDVVTSALATKVGNIAHLEFSVSCTVDSTGTVSFDFQLPWPSKLSPSKAVGNALEPAVTFAQGFIYDPAGGDNTTYAARFNSISAGAGRELRLSLDYITE